MQKITSAYANKMLRSLEEDKAFWVNKESTSSTYVAAVNEEPVIPEYDYVPGSESGSCFLSGWSMDVRKRNTNAFGRSVPSGRGQQMETDWC